MSDFFNSVPDTSISTAEPIKKKTKFPIPILILGGVVILVIILLVVLFISNANKNKNGNPSPNPSNSSTSSSSNADLIYWGLWEPKEVMEPLIKEFEEKNPGIKIQYSQQRYSKYESRVYTRLQQATSSSEPAPDIIRIHNTWVPKFSKYITSVPTNVMSREEYSQKFYPTALEDFTGKDGKLYAIPWEIDGLMVFYNKQLLQKEGVQEPPKDWDSFIELAYKLTKKSSSGNIEQSGLAIGTAKNIQHSAEILSFLLLQEGVDIIDETRTTVSLNNSKAISVFETYTNFAKGEDAIWTSSLRSDLEMFYSGKLAMMIAPSWRAFDIINSNSTIEFGTASLPQLTANENKIYYSTYWGDTVSKSSKNPEAAWKFIAFLSEKEQQKKIFSNSITAGQRAFGEPYSLVELNSEMKTKAYIKPIAEMAPYMKSWQMGDETNVKTYLNEAVTSIIERNTRVNTALKDAETKINEQLAQTNK